MQVGHLVAQAGHLGSGLTHGLHIGVGGVFQSPQFLALDVDAVAQLLHAGSEFFHDLVELGTLRVRHGPVTPATGVTVMSPAAFPAAAVAVTVAGSVTVALAAMMGAGESVRGHGSADEGSSQQGRDHNTGSLHIYAPLALFRVGCLWALGLALCALYIATRVPKYIFQYKSINYKFIPTRHPFSAVRRTPRMSSFYAAGRRAWSKIIQQTNFHTPPPYVPQSRSRGTKKAPPGRGLDASLGCTGYGQGSRLSCRE